jgi:hypothetical protein
MDAEGESGGVNLGALLASASVLGAGVLTPSFAGGFVIVDFFIFAMIGLWIPLISTGYPQGVLPKVVPPLALIFGGSFIGAANYGLRSWMVIDLVKDVGAFASFLAMIVILRAGGGSARKAVSWASAAAAIGISLLLIAETGVRSRAGFANPNLAGHYLATNVIVLSRAFIPRWLRILSMSIGAVGLIAAGSFGALIMTLAACSYLIIATDPVRRKAFLRTALSHKAFLRVAVPIAIVGMSFMALTATTGDSSKSTTGFNASHLERSAGGRFRRWTAALEVARTYPLGIGPGSNKALGLLPTQQEAHNEYLAYLTERGAIGMLGLILLYLTIWKLGHRGGLTRALMLGIALQSAVRETLHYRHLWLLLAFAVVLDEIQRPVADENEMALAMGIDR